MIVHTTPALSIFSWNNIEGAIVAAPRVLSTFVIKTGIVATAGAAPCWEGEDAAALVTFDEDGLFDAFVGVVLVAAGTVEDGERGRWADTGPAW